MKIEFDGNIMGKLQQQAKEFKKEGKCKPITIGRITK